MTTSSSSSDDDNVSLGADQEKVPMSTRDAASSNTVSQRRGSVPSQQDLFTCKYEAH